MATRYRGVFSIFCAWLFLCCGLWFSGCSDHGTTAAWTVVTETGSVTLPAGSALSLPTLRVSGCLGETAIGANGAFRIQEPGASPALATVITVDGAPILYGFVNGAGGSNTIDASSTAVAMLFYALPAFTMLRDAWPETLALLAADANTATLAQVIATRVAASPRAIADGDATIIAAVNAALAGIRGSATFTRLTRAAGRETPLLLQYTTDPGTTQSGVDVAPNSSGNGIVVTNYYRRHLRYFIYRTGYRDAQGVDQPITPWQQVDAVTRDSWQFVPATSGLSGAIGSLIDLAGGQVVYSANRTSGIEMPFLPSDAKRIYYKVAVVGPSLTNTSLTGGLPAQLQASPYVDEIAEAYSTMTALTLMQELVIPALLTVVPAEAFAKPLGGRAAADLAKDLIRTFSSNVPGFAESLAINNWKGALTNVLRGVADNERLRYTLFERFVSSGLLKGNARVIAMGVAAKLGSVMTAVDTFLTAFDLGIVVSHLTSSQPVVLWDVAQAPPNVRLQPNPATVTAGDGVDITVYGSGGLGSPEYHWETPGVHGTLDDGAGHTGKTLTTTTPKIIFTADAEASADDTDTVTVTVYSNSGGSQKLAGSDTAVVNITAGVTPHTELVNFRYNADEAVYYDGDYHVFMTYYVYRLACAVWKAEPGHEHYKITITYPNGTKQVNYGCAYPTMSSYWRVLGMEHDNMVYTSPFVLDDYPDVFNHQGYVYDSTSLYGYISQFHIPDGYCYYQFDAGIQASTRDPAEAAQWWADWNANGYPNEARLQESLKATIEVEPW